MRSVEIRLLGQKNVVKTSLSDPDMLDEVVALVNARIRETEKRTHSSAAPHQIALLAMMDLAQAYVQAKHATALFKEDVAARVEKLRRP